MKADISNNLLLTTVYLSRVLTKHAKQRGIRATAFSVLNNLDHWGAMRKSGTLTQKELASMEDVTQATMSTLIRDLRADNLVYCERSSNDARTTNIGLTQQGEAFLKSEGDEMRALMHSLVDELDTHELEELSKGLAVLAELCLTSASIQQRVGNAETEVTN